MLLRSSKPDADRGDRFVALVRSGVSITFARMTASSLSGWRVTRPFWLSFLAEERGHCSTVGTMHQTSQADLLDWGISEGVFMACQRMRSGPPNGWRSHSTSVAAGKAASCCLFGDDYGKLAVFFGVIAGSAG